jgi:hypothetical protein
MKFKNKQKIIWSLIALTGINCRTGIMLIVSPLTVPAFQVRTIRSTKQNCMHLSVHPVEGASSLHRTNASLVRASMETSLSDESLSPLWPVERFLINSLHLM